MNLKFDRVFDDKDFSVWRIGNWEFTRTIDGEAFWEWIGADEWTAKTYTTNHSPLLTKPKPSGSKKKTAA
jgi:hypothetical protein